MCPRPMRGLDLVCFLATVASIELIPELRELILALRELIPALRELISALRERILALHELVSALLELILALRDLDSALRELISVLVVVVIVYASRFPPRPLRAQFFEAGGFEQKCSKAQNSQNIREVV